MEAVKKKWLWGIFISILSIFAMSHNASAINLTLDLNKYTLSRSIYGAAVNCEFTNVYNQSANDTNNYCLAFGNNEANKPYTGIDHIYTTDTFPVENGDILNFYLYAYSEGYNGFQSDFQIFNITNAELGWNVLDFKEVASGEISPYSQNSGQLGSIGSNYNIDFNSFNFSGFYKIYEITLISVNKGNKHLGLNNSSGTPFIRFPFDAAYGQRYGFRLSTFKIYTFTGDEANKEQQEKTQEAVDDSEDAGNSSTQDAQSGTTGLLNAITGAVSVITSASPTNCRINGNMGNLDIGQLDLCANPAPAFIQTIGSLILILMCVPLAISLFNRFISIFRSFQS